VLFHFAKMALEYDMPIDLVLVRHGESEGNLHDTIGEKGKELDLKTEAQALQEKIYGHHTSQWRLTDLGRKQATRAGKLVQREILQKEIGRFDKFFCSSYARAMETAGFMDLPYASFMINPFIREKDSPGEWQRAGEKPDPSENSKMKERKNLTSFYGDGAGIESPADLLVRVKLFLLEMRQNCAGQRVVVVCHRHVIKAFEIILQNIHPTEYSRAWEMEVPNCLVQWYSRRDSLGLLHSRFSRSVSFALKDVASLAAEHSEAVLHEQELRISAHSHQMSSSDLCEAAATYPQKLNSHDLDSLCEKTKKRKTDG